MNARLFVALSALVFLAAPPAHAQVQPQGELSFAMGFPQGEFADNVTNPGFGINIFGGLGFAQAPVVLGGELGFLIYGQEHRREPFSTTIPDVTVDVETNNNIVMGHFVLRLQPQTGTVRPYADGLFGFKYLFTETRIENDRFRPGPDPIAVSTNFDDIALSYGVGGGVDVRLYHGMLGESPGTVFLKLGARYLPGAEAEYLKKGSIARNDGTVTYEVERSRTTLLVPQIGVKVSL